MAVRLKDIAELMGVSVNTVSRALKDKPDIGEKTRQRIKEAAAALGYRPDLNARSLVLQKTSTIGLAVTESDNPVRMEFCEKLRQRAERDGYRILTTSLRYKWDADNMAAVEELLARRVDGLIIGALWQVAGEYVLGKLLQDCKSNRIPVVLFGLPGELDADCVEIDLEESAYRLTRHLIDKGYRDIAFVLNTDKDYKFTGYRQAMLEAGLKEYIRLIPLPACRMEPAYHAMNRYLDSGGKLPQAIIAGNDLGALGFLSALREHGIDVPGQCAVAGVDNIEFGKFSCPPLTTIGFDNGACAEAVWNLMRQRLTQKENTPAVQIAVPQTLIPRQST